MKVRTIALICLVVGLCAIVVDDMPIYAQAADSPQAHQNYKWQNGGADLAVAYNMPHHEMTTAQQEQGSSEIIKEITMDHPDDGLSSSGQTVLNSTGNARIFSEGTARIYNPTDNTWSYRFVEKSTDIVRRGIGALRFETPKRDPNAPYEDLGGDNYRKDRQEIRHIEGANLTTFYEEDIYTGFSIYIPAETGTVSGPTDVTPSQWNFIHQTFLEGPLGNIPVALNLVSGHKSRLEAHIRYTYPGERQVFQFVPGLDGSRGYYDLPLDQWVDIVMKYRLGENGTLSLYTKLAGEEPKLRFQYNGPISVIGTPEEVADTEYRHNLGIYKAINYDEGQIRYLDEIRVGKCMNCILPWKDDSNWVFVKDDDSEYAVENVVVPTATFTQPVNRYDGNSGDVMSHSAALNVADDHQNFSIGFWVKPEQGPTGEYRAVVHKGADAYERLFAMWLRPEDMRLHYRISTTFSNNEGSDSQAELPLNEWTYVAYVRDGNKLKMYINGVFDSEAVLSGAVVSNTGPLYIGDSPWYLGLDGQISGLAVYDGALTASMINDAMSEAPLDWGDVNCDNQVNIIDALYITQHEVGIRTDGGSCPAAVTDMTLHLRIGDINGDANVDVVDALYIMQCEAQMTNSFCP